MPVGDKSYRWILCGTASRDIIIEVSTSPSANTAVLEDVTLMWPVGDLNRDGIDDVVVGPWRWADWGFYVADPAYLLPSDLGLNPDMSLTLSQIKEAGGDDVDPIEAQWFGIRDAYPIGDFNNDGFDDAIVFAIRGEVPEGVVVDDLVRVLVADDQVDLREGMFGSALLPRTSADLDGSGQVDFADFLVLFANFGHDNATRADGDIDEDGTVGFADFLLLSAQFGYGPD